MAKCGSCEFDGPGEAYLEHVCPATGHKPTEVEHQDKLTNGRFSRIAAKSLARGQARKGEAGKPAKGKKK